MPTINYVDIRDDLDPGNVEMSLNVTNNNDGSIYNSADLNTTTLLAYNPDAPVNSLWELSVNSNPLDPNWNGYTSIAEMVADWPGVSISGEVVNGWNFTTNPDGSFGLTNQSITGGEINIDYDGWYATQQYPSQDMQFYTINIPKSQLELDGIAGYDPLTDASIVLSGAGNTIADAFVAYEGAGGYQASGQYFTVAVPEPSAAAVILGLAAVAVVGFLRKPSRLVVHKG